MPASLALRLALCALFLLPLEAQAQPRQAHGPQLAQRETWADDYEVTPKRKKPRRKLKSDSGDLPPPSEETTEDLGPKAKIIQVDPDMLDPGSEATREDVTTRELEAWGDQDRPAESPPPRIRRNVSPEMHEQIYEESYRGIDEPGYGGAVELYSGALLVDDALGGWRPVFAFGLSGTWHLGRLFAPEKELLHRGLFLEASYLYGNEGANGTEWVKVGTSFHDLSLAVVAGYPISQLLVYGKLGASLFITPVEYEVQGGVTPFTGVKGGVVYGLGVRTDHYVNDKFGISARLEALSFRRDYLNDLLFAGGVGLAF